MMSHNVQKVPALQGNAKIIEEIISVLRDAKGETLFSLWRGCLDLTDTSLARVLGSNILGYLPRHHDSMMILNKTRLTRLDLGAWKEHWIVNHELAAHLFDKMTNSSENDPFFMTFMGPIGSYPCVHGCVSNERFLCWNLEFANGLGGDVAWYIVDMLDNFRVRRVQTSRPGQHYWVNVECHFVTNSKLFVGEVDDKMRQVTMSVIDLESGCARRSASVPWENCNMDEQLNYDGHSHVPWRQGIRRSSSLLMGSVVMTNGLVWLAIGSCNPHGDVWSLRGNMIYDTEKECVVGSMDNAKLFDQNINPRAPSFFDEDSGFFFINSFSQLTWIQLSGDVVKLERDPQDQLTDRNCNLLEGKAVEAWSIVKVERFGGELCIIASDMGMSGMKTGSLATYIILKCDVHEFVRKCHDATATAAPDDERTVAFMWPPFFSRKSIKFGGAFCLC